MSRWHSSVVLFIFALVGYFLTVVLPWSLKVVVPMAGWGQGRSQSPAMRRAALAQANTLSQSPGRLPHDRAAVGAGAFHLDVGRRVRPRRADVKGVKANQVAERRVERGERGERTQG